jgi:TPR repeat protein
VPLDWPESVRWYRKAAEQGDAKAQYALGYMYRHGRGVEMDYAEAAGWYRKAADQGYAEAQSALGYVYEAGKGVMQNYGQAARWYRKAADQGDARAQCYLGDFYACGKKGVPLDLVQAHMWTSLGASHANGELKETCAKSLALYTKMMTPDQIADAELRANEWKRRAQSTAATRGNSER